MFLSLNIVRMLKQKAKETELYADYYVTGVWIDDERVATHLYLHKVENKGEVSRGDRVSVEETMRLLEEGKIIRTMRWSYIRAEWVTGIPLKIITLPGRGKYIKSGSGNVITDNLEHLILMHQMV